MFGKKKTTPVTTATKQPIKVIATRGNEEVLKNPKTNDVARVKIEGENYSNGTLIQPVTFTGRGFCRNNMLRDLPINFSSQINHYILEKDQSMIDPLYMFGDLNRLHYINLDLAVYQVTQYILQDSLINFYNMINSSRFNRLFDYIHLTRELPKFVLTEIDSRCSATIHLPSFINDAVRGFLNNSYDPTKFDQIELERVDCLINNTAFKIGEAILTGFAFYCDQIINTSLFSTYSDVYKEEIYKECKALTNGTFDNIIGEYPNDKYAYCLIYIESVLNPLLTDLITNVIGPNITDVLLKICGSFYFIYSDRKNYLEEEYKDAGRRQRRYEDDEDYSYYPNYSKMEKKIKEDLINRHVATDSEGLSNQTIPVE